MRRSPEVQGQPFGPPLPPVVFYGLAVGSVGGPLGLAALFVPSALSGAAASSGLIVLIGAALFAFPVFAWWRYARQVASAGGLYSFVEAAAGRWPARLHGVAWAVSYFLYLPSTMAYVLWDVLPVAFPHLGAYRAALDLAVPAAMVVGLVAFRTGMLSLTAAAAAAQVALVGVLAGWEIAAAPAGASFGLHVGAATALQDAASVSLLFVCGSLPLYFGSELRRARERTSFALPLAIGVGAACALAGAVALGHFGPDLAAPVPGWEIGRSLGGRALGYAVVVGASVSVLTLVLLEYVALTRLAHVMVGMSGKKAELWVGGAFIASSALALVSPGAAYSDLLKPSLVALYLSELVVFAAYPLFERKLRSLAVALVSSGLMAYGLYNLFRA